jgi:hypothetical protein
MYSNAGNRFGVLAPLLFFGGLAGVGWWWIQSLVRRRRLRKLGFNADDLRSKEGIFKRLGEITVAKIPQKISFNEIPLHSWSEPSKYEQARAAFEALGFQRNSAFVASPQKWVVEFWLSGEPALFATIVDSEGRGVYSEVTVVNGDGSVVSVQNTADCGLQHSEPDRWIHCGLIAPDQLVERALRDRQPTDVGQMNLTECVGVYERAVNEHLVWRRGVGISADEMKKAFERIMRRRSLRG